MEVFQLSFTKIIKLSDSIAEVFVNEGVEYDMKMAEEYHQWIREHMTTPCYILVNKLNAYTYTFEVQRELATIPEIAAIAHVVYTRSSELACQSMMDIPKVRPWNSKIFKDRSEALAWLESQQKR